MLISVDSKERPSFSRLSRAMRLLEWKDFNARSRLSHALPPWKKIMDSSVYFTRNTYFVPFVGL